MFVRSSFLALAFAATAAPVAAQAPEVEYLQANPRSTRPFSDAVRVGHILYLSGQIGTDSTGRLVAGGIGPETRQTLENIKAVLERNGSSMDRVVKCTAMLADIAEWGAMNQVYVTFFPVHKPSRSAFGTSGLALGARVEIECWATVG
jgi:reactive intermediate/imine deaminase